MREKMQLKYDMNVGALYIRLSDGPVARTRDLDDNTSVDLDAADEVVGIEVISITQPWALHAVLSDFQVRPTDATQLRAYFEPTAQWLSGEAPALTIERDAPVLVPA